MGGDDEREGGPEWMENEEERWDEMRMKGLGMGCSGKV